MYICVCCVYTYIYMYIYMYVYIYKIPSSHERKEMNNIKKWRDIEIFYIHNQEDSNLSGCKFFPN